MAAQALLRQAEAARQAARHSYRRRPRPEWLPRHTAGKQQALRQARSAEQQGRRLLLWESVPRRTDRRSGPKADYQRHIAGKKAWECSLLADRFVCETIRTLQNILPKIRSKDESCCTVARKLPGSRRLQLCYGIVVLCYVDIQMRML